MKDFSLNPEIDMTTLMSEQIKAYEASHGEKSAAVLMAIKPLCDYFNIKADYINKDNSEVLILDNQEICCTGNSIDAVIREVIGYIFMTEYYPFKPVGSSVTKAIKSSWIPYGKC